MERQKIKSKLRTVIRWIVWIVLIQFILINISAFLYADKFTRLHTPEPAAGPVSKNIFAKTWRLFSGHRFYKQPEIQLPDFSYIILRFQTSDKIPIEAWYAHTDSIQKGTVILLHGLMGNKSSMLGQASQFLSYGYNVLLLDTRGHGNSGGNRTSYGFEETEEVKLAYDYVKAQGERTILLWGISMGAVEIIKAVAEYHLPVSGIMAEMPFGSLECHVEARMRNMGFPEEPFGFFITFWIGVQRGFNGVGFTLRPYAEKINCPVLMQYGDHDQLVTKRETDDLFKAFASKDKKLVAYEDTYHESLLQKDSILWEKETSNFLKNIK